MFRLKVHNYVYLKINNNINTIKTTQSTLSLARCRILSTFDLVHFIPSIPTWIGSPNWYYLLPLLTKIILFLKKRVYIMHSNRFENTQFYILRARLHDTRSELKPVWNLKPLWNVFPFTWQFTWRFHCGNFPNNSKILLHICKWYLLINANLVNAKKCYQW